MEPGPAASDGDVAGFKVVEHEAAVIQGQQRTDSLAEAVWNSTGSTTRKLAGEESMQSQFRQKVRPRIGSMNCLSEALVGLGTDNGILLLDVNRNRQHG